MRRTSCFSYVFNISTMTCKLIVDFVQVKSLITRKSILIYSSFCRRFPLRTEGKSINTTQIDINHEKVWYSNLYKTFISRYILHQHWYTCPIALPVRWKQQHRSLLTSVAATCATPFHLRLSNVLERISWPNYERITRQTLPTVNRKYFFTNILCIETFCSQRKCAIERCSAIVHSSNSVAILTTETNLSTCSCASAT
jgi:hypothetical protein